jgi:hypothetical protein
MRISNLRIYQLFEQTIRSPSSEFDIKRLDRTKSSAGITESYAYLTLFNFERQTDTEVLQSTHLSETAVSRRHIHFEEEQNIMDEFGLRGYRE